LNSVDINVLGGNITDVRGVQKLP